MVAFEGMLERDWYFLCEFNPAVLRYEGQPVRIDYVDETGRARHYTPDALVTYRDDPVTGPRRPRLCEVKPRALLRDHWSEYQGRFAAAQAYARARGWLFRLVSERWVRTPYLDNARFLLPYRSRHPSPDHTHLLLARLREAGYCDASTLLGACAVAPTDHAALLPDLWTLVATFQVGCDLSAPLTMRSPLRWSETPDGASAR